MENKCIKKIEKIVDKLEESVYNQINRDNGDFEKPFRIFKNKLKKVKC